MKKIQFGLIGAGQIADISASEINDHAAAEVVAIQDLNQKRCEALATKHKIAETFASSEELLVSDQVDAVYIAVPNKFHAPLAIQALQAGKHVILEKPFAMSQPQAEEVAAAARVSGKCFTLGMNLRFFEEVQRIRSAVEEGELGEVYHAKAYWFRRSGIPKLGTWFGNKELAGAGAINDIGVHYLDACLYLMNNFEPASVSGVTYTKFGNRGLGEGDWGNSDKEDITFDVDDFASALIKMKNRATVHLEVTWACHAAKENRQGIELFGTEAGASMSPAKLYRPGSKPNDYHAVEIGSRSNPFPHGNRFHNFINHLTGDEPLAMTLEQGLAVQKILDAVSESSRTGREVVFD